jgi:DNA-binding NarL/FixJ family response regulator
VTTADRSKIRVLLADDHATLRDALTLLINGQPDMAVVATASDGEEAVQKAIESDPDVAVLDVSMPGMNGSAAAAEIRRQAPRVALVALTRHDHQAYVQSLLHAGVSGYILKQSASAELINAIRATASGRQYLDVALRDRQRLPPVPRVRRTSDKPPSMLSAREEQVLRRVALGHSNKDIAAEFDISVKTVEIHKANAMRRLALESRIDIVRFAVLHGWLTES